MLLFQNICVLSNEDDSLASWKLRYLSIQERGREWKDAVAAVATAVPSIILGKDDDDSDEDSEWWLKDGLDFVHPQLYVEQLDRL